MNLYDCHAHLADARIGALASGILAQSATEGVHGVLVTAAKRSEWKTVLSLLDNVAGNAYGALGLHPFFLHEADDGLCHDLHTALVSHPRIVALGEIGLDFWNGRETRDRQMGLLASQLQTARALDLPVILHNRKSWPELSDVLKTCGIDALRGVCHHFSGSIETARDLLDLGLHLSFCGPLTYANARRIHQAAVYTPLDRLLTETDAPDLPIASKRGEQSMPWHTKQIIVKIASLKNVPAELVAQAVEQNFQRLFRVSV